MDYLTTEQAAERLGVGLRRVQAMVLAGRLPAIRFGRALMIKESDLSLVADRKPGRPPKVAEEAEEEPLAKPKKRAAKRAPAKKAVKK